MSRSILSSARSSPAILLVTLGIALLLSTCDAAGPDSVAPGAAWINLDVSAQDGGLFDAVAQFRVVGFFPSSSETPWFNDVFPADQNTILINNLAPGQWRFDAEALDDQGAVLFAGTTVLAIAPDGLTPVSIVLIPQGEGQLVVEFRWPAGVSDIADVSASLSRYLGNNEFTDPPQELELAVSDENGVNVRSYNGTHHAGHYRLFYTVDDSEGNPIHPFGFANPFTPYILPGETTQVLINFETGDVDVTIVLDPLEPLTVTLLGTESGLEVGQQMTVTTDVTGGTPPYAYRWYLNGTRLEDETESQITIGAGLEPGRYRLTVIVSEARVLGSAWHSFTIHP